MERGIPLATRQIARTRYGRRSAGAAIAARLQLDTEFAFDRSALDLPVLDTGGRHDRAVLSCIVDLRSSAVPAHILTCGGPTSEELEHLFGAWIGSKSTIAISQDERFAGAVDLASLAQVRGAKVVFNERRRPGMIIRAAIGSRIGRVDLVEHSKKQHTEDGLVDLALARNVIAHLLQYPRS